MIGKCSIPLRQLADKRPIRQWYKLANKNGDHDKRRGDIELQIWWTFNVKTLAKKPKQTFFQRMGAVVASKEDSDPEDDDELGPNNLSEENKKTEAEIKAEEEAQKKAEDEIKASIGNMEIKDGDYQVQVHLIEARDLAAKNMDGTSDPVVYVECFDQKQNTKVIYATVNCVFDEVLIFNVKKCAKETFEDAVIKVTVMDANSVPMMKNTEIGSFAIDATSVYFSKDHEMYRKWVALMDDEDPGDTGVQGYLKLSIQVLGPGDKLKVHDEEEEARKEKEASKRNGGDDLSSMGMCMHLSIYLYMYVCMYISIYANQLH